MSLHSSPAPKIIPTLREYIEALSTEELWKIADSHTKFENQGGIIGDEAVRKHSDRYLRLIDYSGCTTTIWLNLIGFEAFRTLAVRQRTAAK